MKKILITGGAGFIGSHVLRLFINKYPNYQIFNLDALTYAGNLENITDIQQAPNYTFIKGDISDADFINELFDKHQFDGILHLAAESHVDRSIKDPLSFVKTNIIGTVNLLNAAKKQWKGKEEGKRFYHISTDEVYGSLGAEGLFTETTPYDPNSPYSASKASSDHFVRAYGETYGLPYVITNCSNNYGPNHFPEKLIPLFISNIINKKPLPVYGDGNYTRDWLFVKDHAAAIDLVFHEGKNHETYNIGGFNEWKNIDLVKLLCQQMDKKLGRPEGESAKLITYVKDRPGHDLRYAIDASKITKELGWKPSVTFEQGLDQTIDWYLTNKEWLANIDSGEYTNYYKKHYLKTLETCHHCGELKEDCYHGYIAMTLPIPEAEALKEKWGGEGWWNNLERTDLTDEEMKELEGLATYDQLLSTVGRGVQCEDCAKKEAELYDKYYPRVGS